MVPRLAIALLALSLLASGCSGPFLAGRGGLADWEPLACDPTKPESRNLLTAKDPSPSGDMNALAARFGQALGDPVVTKSPQVSSDGRSEWKTTHGVIRTRHAIDEQTVLEYEARRNWPGLDAAAGKTALDAFAQNLGLPGERVVNYTAKDAGQFDGKIHQALDGHIIGNSPTLVTYVERGQVEGAFVRVSLRPFWVLPSVDRKIDEARALQIGEAFLRCQLDQLGRTHSRGYEHRYTGLLYDWLPIHNKTLAYAIQSKFHNPMGGTCPSEKTEATIYVDAWTGSVLTWDWNKCGRLSTPAPTAKA